MKNTLKLAGLLFVVTLSLCDNAQSGIFNVNDENWAVVGIGQDKAVALHLLGEPDNSEQITLPLGVEAERLTWKRYFPSRKLYTLDLVLNRVVAKHTEAQ
jgi:hypothetical protein